MRLGACQLPVETRCERDSDCPSTLVCTMGECTNECACPDGVPCRDCPAGATCLGRPDGTRACLDPSTRSCVWNSECSSTGEVVCAFDQRCRVECTPATEAIDCRFGDACVELEFDEGDAGRAQGYFCVPRASVGDAGGPRPDAGS